MALVVPESSSQLETEASGFALSQPRWGCLRATNETEEAPRATLNPRGAGTCAVAVLKPCSPACEFVSENSPFQRFSVRSVHPFHGFPPFSLFIVSLVLILFYYLLPEGLLLVISLILALGLFLLPFLLVFN